MQDCLIAEIESYDSKTKKYKVERFELSNDQLYPEYNHRYVEVLQNIRSTDKKIKYSKIALIIIFSLFVLLLALFWK